MQLASSVWQCACGRRRCVAWAGVGGCGLLGYIWESANHALERRTDDVAIDRQNLHYDVHTYVCLLYVYTRTYDARAYRIVPYISICMHALGQVSALHIHLVAR